MFMCFSVERYRGLSAWDSTSWAKEIYTTLAARECTWKGRILRFAWRQERLEIRYLESKCNYWDNEQKNFPSDATFVSSALFPTITRKKMRIKLVNLCRWKFERRGKKKKEKFTFKKTHDLKNNYRVTYFRWFVGSSFMAITCRLESKRTCL